MGKNHCGDSFQTAFMRHKSFQDVLFRCDYAESVASFSHQIQSEYYGKNRSLTIKGIQWLAFHIPHVHFMGTNQCGDSLQTAFMRHKYVKGRTK